jgi:hypothetical protein
MSTTEELRLQLAISVARAVEAVSNQLPSVEGRNDIIIELTHTLRLLNNPVVTYTPADDRTGRERWDIEFEKGVKRNEQT